MALMRLGLRVADIILKHEELDLPKMQKLSIGAYPSRTTLQPWIVREEGGPLAGISILLNQSMAQLFFEVTRSSKSAKELKFARPVLEPDLEAKDLLRLKIRVLNGNSHLPGKHEFDGLEAIVCTFSESLISEAIHEASVIESLPDEYHILVLVKRTACENALQQLQYACCTSVALKCLECLFDVSCWRAWLEPIMEL